MRFVSVCAAEGNARSKKMQGKAGNACDQRYFALEQSNSCGADRPVLVVDRDADDFDLVNISLHP